MGMDDWGWMNGGGIRGGGEKVREGEREMGLWLGAGQWCERVREPAEGGGGQSFGGCCDWLPLLLLGAVLAGACTSALYSRFGGTCHVHAGIS